MRPSHKSAKKVLIIAPQPFFANRGTPLNVKAIVCRLAELGYQVHLLVLPHGNHIDLDGVTVHRCWRIPGISRIPIGFSWPKFFYDVLLFFHAAILSFRYRFAVYHGIEEGAFIAGVLGLLSRTPYVVDMDSCMLEQLGNAQLKRWPIVLHAITAFEKYITRRATAVLTVCAALTKKAAAIAPHVPVFQIEDFPLEDGSIIDQRVVEQIQKSLNLTNKNVLLYTGNFESYQGIDLLLESFAILQGNESQAAENILVLVGGEPEHILAAQKKAAALGIADAIVFVGARPTNEMGAYMSLADVLISPRVIGGNTPLKIYTYMAASKPIVATTIESHTQILNGDNAFLAESNPLEFSKAIKLALDNSDVGRMRREKIVASSKQLVDSRFSKGAFDRRLSELYQHVLPRASNASRISGENHLPEKDSGQALA